jgi:hypothetical protein
MSRRLWIVGGLLAVVVAACGDSAFAGPVQVRVLYQARECLSSPQMGTLAPVTAGKMMLRRGSEAPVLVTLDDKPVTVTVDGEGALTATLLLETPRVKVVTTPGSVLAEIISLGTGIESNGAVTFSIGAQGDRDNGHVNVLVQMEKAAKLAELASPKKLSLVTVTVFDGLLSGRPTTHFNAPDEIDVGQANGADAQWEADTMYHEYGHFVMQSVAPGGPSGDDHDIRASYPDKPDLAWTEGFAAAFAAAVGNHAGVLQWNCSNYQNLGIKPANPTLKGDFDVRYAQYNETRVGAAAYQLLDYLGENAVGLARLLDAMTAYKRDGHGVWVARDLRDMAVQEFEKDSSDHVDIDSIFTGQQLGWGELIGFGLPMGDPGFRAADFELAISVTGPGGFDCRVTSDVDTAKLIKLDDGRAMAQGIKAAEGGLAFSANDDCYMISGDGKVPNQLRYHGMGMDQVEIPFPYLAGLAHWQGLYTVKAKYVCEYDPRMNARRTFKCPEALNISLWVFNLPLFIRGTTGLGPHPVMLHRNVDQAVATFSADGKCTLLDADGATDCGF